MSAFDNATKFFVACESLEGWSGCQAYVMPDATFTAQCEPLIDVTTVAERTQWMAGLGNGPLAGCGYDVHARAYDERTRTALFFATFRASHDGDGGPVPPTHQSTETHYLYALTMNDQDKVEQLVKVWNAPWALNQLGWLNDNGSTSQAQASSKTV